MEHNDNFKYLECDFYSVEEIDGEKVIHVSGYFYHADDGSNTPYRCLEWCWFYLKPGFTESDYDYKQDQCKTYIDDLTEQDAIDGMKDYFNNKSFTELPMSQVTQDTPIGNYVDY